MTFSQASLSAAALTRTVSGWVIKPGDTSWDEDRRPFSLRMDQHPTVVVDVAGPADIAAESAMYPLRGSLFRRDVSHDRIAEAI